jgi:hypothetical protein
MAIRIHDPQTAKTAARSLHHSPTWLAPTSEWNFLPFGAINSGYENSISHRFDMGRAGWRARGWLRKPTTGLYAASTGGGSLLPCPRPNARPRGCAGSGGTPGRHGRDRFRAATIASGGGCSSSCSGAGLRLDCRILELEWGGLVLGSRRLGAAPFPRGSVVWRSLGLSRRAACLGARSLALRRNGLNNPPRQGI